MLYVGSVNADTQVWRCAVLQDFFGGKHVVLLGGSWATLNSIAGRQSFRNWYQKGQQHVFAKFRLVQG